MNILIQSLERCRSERKRRISLLRCFTSFSLTCGILFLSLNSVLAVSGSGAVGAQFLNLGVSARSIAMGNAYSAVSFGGVISSNYNPAALYGTDRPELSLMHYRYILDSQFSYLGYAQPLDRKSRMILAANVIHGSYGAMDETQVNVGQESGEKTGRTFGAQDSAGTLSFAVLPTSKLGVGVSFKYISQEIAGVQANVPAGDIGLFYKMGPKLAFSLAARNFGPDLKFDKTSTPLPQNYIFGVSYALLRNEALLFSADFEKPRNQTLAVRVGGEFNLGPQFRSESSKFPHIALRAGHDGFKEAGGGLSLGAGLRLGNYALDYAFIPFGQLGEAHRLSATIRFGRPYEVKSSDTTRFPKEFTNLSR